MRIKCAAIHLENKNKYEGRYHGEARAAARDAGEDRLMIVRADEGFMTECGRFILRKAALRIALNADQVIDPEKVNWNFGLFSEDLK